MICGDDNMSSDDYEKGRVNGERDAIVLMLRDQVAEVKEHFNATARELFKKGEETADAVRAMTVQVAEMGVRLMNVEGAVKKNGRTQNGNGRTQNGNGSAENGDKVTWRDMAKTFMPYVVSIIALVVSVATGVVAILKFRTENGGG